MIQSSTRYFLYLVDRGTFLYLVDLYKDNAEYNIVTSKPKI